MSQPKETQEIAKAVLYEICSFRDEIMRVFSAVHEDSSEEAQFALRGYFTQVWDGSDDLLNRIFTEVFGMGEEDIKRMEAQSPNVLKLVTKEKDDG